MPGVNRPYLHRCVPLPGRAGDNSAPRIAVNCRYPAATHRADGSLAEFLIVPTFVLSDSPDGRLAINDSVIVYIGRKRSASGPDSYLFNC